MSHYVYVIFSLSLFQLWVLLTYAIWQELLIKFWRWNVWWYNIFSRLSYVAFL